MKMFQISQLSIKEGKSRFIKQVEYFIFAHFRWRVVTFINYTFTSEFFQTTRLHISNTSQLWKYLPER